MEHSLRESQELGRWDADDCWEQDAVGRNESDELIPKGFLLHVQVSTDEPFGGGLTRRRVDLLARRGTVAASSAAAVVAAGVVACERTTGPA